MADGFTPHQALLWMLSHPDRVASVCEFLSPGLVEFAVRDSLAALAHTCGVPGPVGQCVLLAGHREFDHENSLGGRWPVDRYASTGQA